MCYLSMDCLNNTFLKYPITIPHPLKSFDQTNMDDWDNDNGIDFTMLPFDVNIYNIYIYASFSWYSITHINTIADQ